MLSVGEEERLLATSGNYLYTAADNGTTLVVYDRTQPTYSGYRQATRTVNLPYSLSGILRISTSGNTLYV